MMFTLLNNKTSVIILLVSNTCIDKFKSQAIQKQSIIQTTKHKQYFHS